jgi:hypothetical protein
MTLSNIAKVRRVGKQFVHGGPCRRGHSGLRYAANHTCVECAHEQQRVAEQLRAQRMRDNPDFFRARRAIKNLVSRKWRATHKAEKRAEWSAWRANLIQRLPTWADLAAIKLVYQVAEQRSRLSGVKHVVDHFYPLNGKTVSGLHVPLNLRVIPETENLLKGNGLPMAA